MALTPSRFASRAPRKPKLETGLDALAIAANEAARREATQWFFFVTLLVCLTIAVARTNHRMLFLDEPVQLPIFAVPVPLLGFYWLAPGFVVVLHFYLLTQIRVMAGKIHAFLDAVETEAAGDSDALRLALKRLDPFVVAQILAARRFGDRALGLRAMVWTTLAVAPVGLLLFVLLRFLPYQDVPTTWWHRVVLIADIAVLWLALRDSLFGNSGARSLRPWYAATCGVMALFLAVATIPGEGAEFGGPLTRVRNVLFDHDEYGDRDRRVSYHPSAWRYSEPVSERVRNGGWMAG